MSREKTVSPVGPEAPGRTPHNRDHFADFLRTIALGAVIFGHWIMAAIWREDGELRIDNVLNHATWLWPLTWLFVLVPLFFLVGGFTNANSWLRIQSEQSSPDAAPIAHHVPGSSAIPSAYGIFIRRRSAGLLPPTLPFLGLVAVSAAVALALGAPSSLVRGIVTVVVMPLWFIAVYLALAALVPVMHGLHRRYGIAVWLWMAAGAMLFDALRFVTGNSWAAAPNYIFVWGLAQQIGFAYADGTIARWGQRTCALIAGGVLVLLAIAVTWGAWPPSMIGLSGERSNFAPPALPALLLMIVQIFGFLAVRQALNSWLSRPRVTARLEIASRYAMPAFLWHLPVLVIVTGCALAARIPLPAPASPAWWLTRPLAWAVLFAGLCGALWLLGRIRAAMQSWRVDHNGTAQV